MQVNNQRLPYPHAWLKYSLILAIYGLLYFKAADDKPSSPYPFPRLQVQSISKWHSFKGQQLRFQGRNQFRPRHRQQKMHHFCKDFLLFWTCFCDRMSGVFSIFVLFDEKKRFSSKATLRKRTVSPLASHFTILTFAHLLTASIRL